MKYKKIITNLSFSEKVAMAEALEKSIREERHRRLLRKDLTYENIRKVVCENLGVVWNETSRKRELVTARVLVIQALVVMGYTETTIGELIGKDHSTVHNCKNIFDTWERYPYMYPEEMRVWKTLKKKML